MKKLMLTTAMVSVITTAAIAQTTITGELRISGSMLNAEKGFGATSGTSNSSYGMGTEQQINIQTKGKLNLGGLDYAAGFSIENDGEQTGTLFNENLYIDLTNASSGTTVSFGRDHIQRSDTDNSATNLVGFSANELSQTGTTTNQSTRFKQNIGAAPSQQMGVALLQKTPVGTFSYNYVPNNSGSTAGATLLSTSGDTAGASGSETVSANTTSGYEYGFVGDLSVKGLQVHYFKNANDGVVTAANTIKAEGKNYGVKYNFGNVTVAANKKIHQAETTSTAFVSTAVGTGNAEITETAYAAAFAVNKDVTIGLLYAKAVQDTLTSTADQEVKAINIGYALGPVDLAVGYAKNTNLGGIVDNDGDHFIARFIGKF
jgi:hypothetical protein